MCIDLTHTRKKLLLQTFPVSSSASSLKLHKLEEIRANLAKLNNYSNTSPAPVKPGLFSLEKTDLKRVKEEDLSCETGKKETTESYLTDLPLR